jgi:hypothetical protein
VIGRRLRAWLERPLADADRPRLAVVCLTIVATGAVIMLATSADPPPRARNPVATTPAPTADPSPSIPAAPPPTPPKVTAAEIRQAKRAARRFLAGYLAYTYGRRRARTIRAATAELRRTLARQPPRVRRARDRRRRARVELIHTDEVATRGIGVIALVADRARRYSVHVALERRGDRWLIARVGA